MVRIAAGFAGSQKTLMVGLHLIVAYFLGLSILTTVVFHLVQLLGDTFVANWLRVNQPSS